MNFIITKEKLQPTRNGRPSIQDWTQNRRRSTPNGHPRAERVKGIVTIFLIFVGKCDLESFVASGHKKILRPSDANIGLCDFKYVFAFGNNQLWRPLAAKVKGHHSALHRKMVSLAILFNMVQMHGTLVILTIWQTDFKTNKQINKCNAFRPNINLIIDFINC